MDTIAKYEEENQNERGGWRSVVGAILAFVGFIVFANATFIALFFRQCAIAWKTASNEIGFEFGSSECAYWFCIE